MTSITLINVFTVPAAEADRFLRLWKHTAGIMAAQPGFVRARMHRTMSDAGDADPRFVNVAEWESQEAFANATANPDFRASSQAMADDPELHVVARPAVYEVVVDLNPGDQP